MRDLRWPAKIYLSALVGLAAILIGRGLVTPERFGDHEWPTLLVLALLFLVCESVPTLLNVEQAAMSVSFSAALAAVVLVGDVGAAMVGATAVLSVRPGLPPHKRLFNGAQFAICGYAAGWVFDRLGGRPDVPGIDRFIDLFGPFIGAAAVFVPLNLVLFAVMLSLAGGLRTDEVPLRGLAQFLISYLGVGGGKKIQHPFGPQLARN